MKGGDGIFSVWVKLFSREEMTLTHLLNGSLLKLKDILVR